MKYKLIGHNDTTNIIKTVLLNRGIEDVNTYLNLTENQVYNYNNLTNIQAAVQCFISHYENKNKIVIMPDEDCDGYTSSAMLYLYVKAIDPDYPIEYVMHKYINDSEYCANELASLLQGMNVLLLKLTTVGGGRRAVLDIKTGFYISTSQASALCATSPGTVLPFRVVSFKRRKNGSPWNS